MKSLVTSLGVGQAYRVRWPARIISLSAFVICAAIAVEISIRGTRNGTRPAFALFVIGLGVLISGIGVLSDFYNRVTLYANAIEYRSIWSTSTLQFGEIRGRREYLAHVGRGSVPHLQIVPNDGRLEALDFAKGYNFDDAFWTWFKSLSDLDRVSQ